MPQQPPLSPQPAEQDTQLFAILGLVLSCVALPIVGVVFSHIALGRVKRSGSDENRGLALAGVIVGWAMLALIGVIIIMMIVMMFIPLFFLMFAAGAGGL